MKSTKCLSSAPILLTHGYRPVKLKDMEHLKPERETCHCGAGLNSATEKVVPLITSDEIVKVRVSELSCSADPTHPVISIDGSEQGFINMGTYLVSHELLRSYFRQFLINT